MEYKLAFIGFGTVGQGLAEIILQEREALKAKYGVDFLITAISDQMKGSLYDPAGLDIAALLNCVQETGSLESFPCETKGWDSDRTIEESNADAVVEVSFTDLATGEPAISYIRKALESGKNVVTTNKGPIALCYKELTELAAANNKVFAYEGTVMSGSPVFSFAEYCLPGSRIHGIKGILNGTTNYMLCEMEKGLSYEEALKDAQEAGYAEAVPDADVLGYDAKAKIAILSEVLMDEKLDLDSIPCEGITGISVEDIKSASAEGCRYKLIAELSCSDGKVSASVAPQKLPLTDPLAGVSGPTNAITFTSELLGETTVVGAGAGKIATGYALLKDLLEIHRNSR